MNGWPGRDRPAKEAASGTRWPGSRGPGGSQVGEVVGRAEAEVELDQADGVAREVKDRVDHQGDEPHTARTSSGGHHSDQRRTSGRPGARPQEAHHRPYRDGQHRQGVAHMGLDQEGADEGHAGQPAAVPRAHHPGLQEQEGEEREGEVGVPQLLEDPRPGGPVGQGDHGHPRDIHRSPPAFHDRRAVQTTATPWSRTFPTRDAQACWRATPENRANR